jgi:xylulokinase
LALVLGVDSSTQSTKVEMRDTESGALVGSGQAPHPPTFPPRSEQDPEVWRDALVEARRQAGTRLCLRWRSPRNNTGWSRSTGIRT